MTIITSTFTIILQPWEIIWLLIGVHEGQINHTFSLWTESVAYLSKLDSSSVSDSSVSRQSVISPALFSRLDDIVTDCPLRSRPSALSVPFTWPRSPSSSLLMLWSTSTGKVWISAAFSSRVCLSTTTSTKFCLVHPYTIALKNPCNGSVNDWKQNKDSRIDCPSLWTSVMWITTNDFETLSFC